MDSVITDKYALYNGDCIELTSQMKDESVDFQVFSPPFANLYIYSDDLRDMGNCKNVDEFFEQFDYLIPQLYRILKTGRLCAVHCKQIVKYKGRDGVSGWTDFRGAIIRHFEKFGFQYHSDLLQKRDQLRRDDVQYNFLLFLVPDFYTPAENKSMFLAYPHIPINFRVNLPSHYSGNGSLLVLLQKYDTNMANMIWTP